MINDFMKKNSVKEIHYRFFSICTDTDNDKFLPDFQYTYKYIHRITIVLYDSGFIKYMNVSFKSWSRIPLLCWMFQVYILIFNSQELLCK